MVHCVGFNFKKCLKYNNDHRKIKTDINEALVKIISPVISNEKKPFWEQLPVRAE